MSNTTSSPTSTSIRCARFSSIDTHDSRPPASALHHVPASTSFPGGSSSCHVIANSRVTLRSSDSLAKLISATSRPPTFASRACTIGTRRCPSKAPCAVSSARNDST
jgi:hypothetical protein